MSVMKQGNEKKRIHNKCKKKFTKFSKEVFLMKLLDIYRRCQNAECDVSRQTINTNLKRNPLPDNHFLNFHLVKLYSKVGQYSTMCRVPPSFF